jgi:predicted nucleic acid-binding protein
VYEQERLDFAEAYLVAQAEATGVDEILSFDRTIDRIGSVTRREP